MGLPNNGRIIIIDDKIEQALPLINFLSKSNHSYKYFDGTVENLPNVDCGFDDIRLIFLDINLQDDKRPERNHFAQLKSVLNRIIYKVSQPYLLVAWTRHPEELEQLDEYVFDSTLGMNLKKPIAIISANKLDHIDIHGVSTGGDSDSISDVLLDQLKKYPELLSLLLWESEIHKATNEMIFNFFPSFNDYNEWSKKTRNMLKLFSWASIGERHHESSSNHVKLNSAFEVINQVFMDTFENNFYSIEKDLDFPEDLASYTLSTDLNTKLLLDFNPKENRYPGTVSLSDDKKVDLKVFTNSTKEAQIRKIEVALESAKNIKICLDPLCDYVNKKVVYSKHVLGLLLEASHVKLIDSKSEAVYISPVFSYENTDYILVLDFRFLFTTETTETTETDVLFRIRAQVFSEIQSKLARHVSRQAILYL